MDSNGSATGLDCCFLSMYLCRLLRPWLFYRAVSQVRLGTVLCFFYLPRLQTLFLFVPSNDSEGSLIFLPQVVPPPLNPSLPDEIVRLSK